MFKRIAATLGTVAVAMAATVAPASAFSLGKPSGVSADVSATMQVEKVRVTNDVVAVDLLIRDAGESRSSDTSYYYIATLQGCPNATGGPGLAAQREIVGQGTFRVTLVAQASSLGPNWSVNAMFTESGNRSRSYGIANQDSRARFTCGQANTTAYELTYPVGAYTLKSPDANPLAVYSWPRATRTTANVNDVITLSAMNMVQGGKYSITWNVNGKPVAYNKHSLTVRPEFANARITAAVYAWKPMPEGYMVNGAGMISTIQVNGTASNKETRPIKVATSKVKVSSIGKVKGKAKAGRVVKISKPKVEAGAKVKYAWTVNGKVVDRDRTVRIKKSYVGKKLAVKVTVSKTNHKTVKKTKTVGRVKR